jgi:hypothetical protein
MPSFGKGRLARVGRTLLSAAVDVDVALTLSTQMTTVSGATDRLSTRVHEQPSEVKGGGQSLP